MVLINIPLVDVEKWGVSGPQACVSRTALSSSHHRLDT